MLKYENKRKEWVQLLDIKLDDIANGIVASLTVESMKTYWEPLKKKLTTYLKLKKAEPLLECIEAEPHDKQYMKILIGKLKDTGFEQDIQLKEILNEVLKNRGGRTKEVKISNSMNNNNNSTFNIIM